MLSYSDPVLLATVDSSYTAQSINAELIEEMIDEEKNKKILKNSTERSNSSKLLQKTMSDFRKTYMQDSSQGQL